MVTMKRLLLVLVLVVVAVAGARCFLIGDKAKINKRLESLRNSISKPADESTAQMVLKMERLTGLLADPVTVRVPAYQITETFTPRELTQKAVGVRANLETLGLDFHDVSIELEHAAKARVTMTVRAWADSGKRGADTVEVVCELVKVEGKWRFATFTQVEVLER